VTPLVLSLVQERYPDRPDLRAPFAFAVFMAVGVAPFVVSNPMNMIVADYADVNFNQYARWMVPIALVGWVIAFAVLRLVFGRRLAEVPSTDHQPPKERLRSEQRWMIGLLLAVVAAYPVVAMVDGPSIWIVAVVGAVVAVLIAWTGGGVPLRETVVRGVAWNILAFLFAVVVIALGLRNVGFVGLLASLYDGASIGLIGPVAAVGSSMLNNHPMAILNLLALESLPETGRPEIFAMLIGGDLGPRLLPIGSLAGLLWLDGCRRMGLTIRLRQFVTMGVLVTTPTLAASLLVLHIESRDWPSLAELPQTEVHVVVDAPGRSYAGVEAVCPGGWRVHVPVRDGVATLPAFPSTGCALHFKGGGPRTVVEVLPQAATLRCTITGDDARCEAVIE